MNRETQSRRKVVQSVVFGILALPATSLVSQNIREDKPGRYPALDEERVREVVGVSHFNLDRLKELVGERPELAKSSWDWGFGDFESAIGAASHVGRVDIAEYLIGQGAKPTIFTFAMLGHYEIVEAILAAEPAVSSHRGPHGIGLIAHARVGMRSNGKSAKEIDDFVEFLSQFAGTGAPSYLQMDLEEKAKYVGDYIYGKGASDGFSVRLNMRENLALGRLGKTGGQIMQIDKSIFKYGGAPSVQVRFQMEGDKIKSLWLIEPHLTLKAIKIN